MHMCCTYLPRHSLPRQCQQVKTAGYVPSALGTEKRLLPLCTTSAVGPQQRRFEPAHMLTAAVLLPVATVAHEQHSDATCM